MVARDRDDLLERLPAGRAEPLEAGELQLDRHAGRAGRDDRRAAVLRDGLAVCARARRAAPGSPADPLHGLWPQCCRVGVEPEYDATAALLNERRKPVGEMRRRAPGSQGLTRRRQVLARRS